ncbi:hypothetical protein K7472_07550 [Streptomyces sp. PTM05]|uniref:DUF3592 domain-containing protein n=1 Tax=Streptantibioticus parmotrematis TaxID=2873249 RepID=A0ABS7QNE4_9ACTN|nr:hypothetical protein [Streptantibioticus parmotrematis]MBY8884698.1 hypothetical protein [Streptantibioticus parmotrematis]
MREKTPPPAIDDLLAAASEDHLRLLESGGYPAERLREMGTTEEGARQARALLTSVPPADETAADGTTLAMLDALSEENRRRLVDASGFGMDALRKLAASGSGARYVRKLLAEHTDVLDVPGESRGARKARRLRFLTEGTPDGPGPGDVVSGWLIMLAAGLVGLVLCAVLTAWIGALTILVAVLYFAVVLSWAGGKVRSSRGSGPALAMFTITFLAVVAMVPFRAQDWYLAARGVQAQATVVAPRATWSHGHKEEFCQVRLPDGRVRQTEGNDSTCTTAVGSTATVVYDPSDWYGPRFGPSSGNNVDISGGVAVAALVALLAAPVWAVSAARKRKTTSL